jgi:hypothetical protein
MHIYIVLTIDNDKRRKNNGKEKFEYRYTKGVINTHKSKKNKQYNNKKTTDKKVNNDHLPNTTQKTKDRAT